MKKITAFILVLCIGITIILLNFYLKHRYENEILKKVISMLSSDSRIAEVIVTDVRDDKNTGKKSTSIKFLEYDVNGKPLMPLYFTFSGNIIQFQSLVIRFDDLYIKRGDKLKGKSAYLFMKVFMLDGNNTKEYEIAKVNEIPSGYKVQGEDSNFERKLWEKFWQYALKPEQSKPVGIKNAQIEAPGTMFIPGIMYTLKIEHDGGIRIDTSSIPQILQGEHIPK